MMSKFSKILSLGLICCTSLAASASASLSQFSDFSLGGTTAGWDIFYGGNYLPAFNFATGTEGNPISNANGNLNLFAAVPSWKPGPPSPQNTQATGPTGSNNSSIPGDRELFYTFFAPTVNFSIGAFVEEGDSLSDFALQVSGANADDIISISLNGAAPNQSGVNQNGVSFWSWTGLNLAAGENVTVNFSSSGVHHAYDAFQIQTDAQLSAVPEPGIIALLALSGSALLFFRRRR